MEFLDYLIAIATPLSTIFSNLYKDKSDSKVSESTDFFYLTMDLPEKDVHRLFRKVCYEYWDLNVLSITLPLWFRLKSTQDNVNFDPYITFSYGFKFNPYVSLPIFGWAILRGHRSHGSKNWISQGIHTLLYGTGFWKENIEPVSAYIKEPRVKPFSVIRVGRPTVEDLEDIEDLDKEDFCTIRSWDGTMQSKGLDSVLLSVETRRYIESIIRRSLNYEMIIENIRSKQPNRIGIVLHGEKGTGKSETAHALAIGSVKKIDVTSLHQVVQALHHIQSNDSSYTQERGNLLFRKERDISIASRGFLFESYLSAKNFGYSGTLEEFRVRCDADPNLKEVINVKTIIIDDFDRIDFKDSAQIPLMLNAIDSMGFSEVILFIITTNDYTKIPSVIRRAGRFSYNIKFSLMDEAMVREYVEKTWGDVANDQMQRFLDLLVGRPSAWPISLVNNSLSVNDALNFLQETKDQQDLFEQDEHDAQGENPKTISG